MCSSYSQLEQALHLLSEIMSLQLKDNERVFLNVLNNPFCQLFSRFGLQDSVQTISVYSTDF